MGHLVALHPKDSSTHSFPGVVRIGLMKDLNAPAKLVVGALMILARPWKFRFRRVARGICL
ncbi:hypothetical protein BJX99DRAFT_224346, partial [Aspergillus californicus]